MILTQTESYYFVSGLEGGHDYFLLEEMVYDIFLVHFSHSAKEENWGLGIEPVGGVDCEECCIGLPLLHIIHHLVAAENHHSFFFLCLWVCGARLIWPRLGWAALYQMLQLDGKMCFSLQLCGSMGMTLLHVSLLLLGPASQPGHVVLKQWQRCKKTKRNLFAKPRLRAQVLSFQLIYHRLAGVAGLSPKSWSIKGGTLGEALARIWM